MASNKILIIGCGCALLPVIAECAARGLEVEVSKSPSIPEPLKIEFKAARIKSIQPYHHFIEPNPRPWERKKKGQKR